MRASRNHYEFKNGNVSFIKITGIASTLSDPPGSQNRPVRLESQSINLLIMPLLQQQFDRRLDIPKPP